MHQEQIGDAGQPLHGVGIVVGDRLVGSDCRWSSPGVTFHSLQQQMMERRVRQHHAEARVARRDRIGHRCPRALRMSTIGRRGEESRARSPG